MTAHLTSEVVDTLARLQDGHLHVLCGLFGMGRLLLQSRQKRRGGGNMRANMISGKACEYSSKRLDWKNELGALLVGHFNMQFCVITLK